MYLWYVSSFAFVYTLLNTELSSAQSNQDKYCPSDDWIYCGVENQYCYMEKTIRSTTVSFGANSNEVGQYSFWDLTNADASNEFVFFCADKFFGDSYTGVAKGCCYRNNKQLYNSSNDNSMWTSIASHEATFNTKGLAYVRYGGKQQYWYRWLEGSFQCNNNYFPYINGLDGAYIECSKYNDVNQTIYSQSTFVNCGATNNGGTCNANVVPNGNSLSLVRYGDGPNTKNQWLYIYAYSSNEQIECNKYLFRNFGGQYCDIHNGTIFTAFPLGSWELAEDCFGCPDIPYSVTINQGQTSTSSESKTQEWSESLQDTVSEGLIFEGVQYTTTYSNTVSTTIERSYSQSVSKTCPAPCGNGTQADWKVWQWQMNAQEYQGAGISPFQIYACYYVCNTETNKPKCLPTYCADVACQTCKY